MGSRGWGGGEGCRNHLGTVECQGPRGPFRGPSPSAVSQADGPRALVGSASLAQQDPKSTFTCLFLLSRFSHLKPPHPDICVYSSTDSTAYLLSMFHAHLYLFPLSILRSFLLCLQVPSMHSCPVPGPWRRHPETLEWGTETCQCRLCYTPGTSQASSVSTPLFAR